MDGSQDSQHALQWTVQELWAPGDVVCVAHCIPYLPASGGLYAFPDGRLAMVNFDQMLASKEQYLLAEQQELARTCEDAFRRHQVPHVVDILREGPLGTGSKGRVAEALFRKAEELQAVALVVASHAKSGLSEFVLGSVTAHCIQHATRPVLVLHAPQPRQAPQAGGSGGVLGRLASAAANALGAGLPAAAAAGAEAQRVASPVAAPAGTAEQADKNVGSGGRGRSIVLAVDDSEASEAACDWALTNMWRPEDTVHLLRIIPTLPYRATYGGPAINGMTFYADPPTEAFQAAAERCVQHRFEPRLQAAGVRYEVHIVVEPTDDSVAGVGEAICQHAKDLQAAAVVLGSHMSGGLMQVLLGSVANYVAHHCPRPVAVLH